MLTRRAVVTAGLQVGAVPADPGDDRLAVGPVARSGMELTPRASISSSRWPTICLRPPDSAMPPAAAPSAAEVELGQPVDPAQAAAGDLVELLLQRGGEVVVDQLRRSAAPAGSPRRRR